MVLQRSWHAKRARNDRRRRPVSALFTNGCRKPNAESSDRFREVLPVTCEPYSGSKGGNKMKKESSIYITPRKWSKSELRFNGRKRVSLQLASKYVRRAIRARPRYGNTANKTLPSWLLPKLTAHALKASSRPDAILILPSTVCSSRVTTRNPNFQQLAKDKKLNPDQWEVHLIEFKICEDTRPDLQLQKAKAQHSTLMANLNIQGYREVKLHVILVGAMGTIYKDYTYKPLADLNLDYLMINKLTHKLNKHSIRHASALIETRYALQYNTSNNSQGLGAMANNPPDPH